MKKLVSMLSVIAMTLSMVVMPAMAKDNITVELDGKAIEFDVQPQIINDRTMVPVRAIFEALGATVDWDQATQTVISTKGDTVIRLTIDNPVMKVNDKDVTIDAPACIVDERTLVPVRAISEAFNLSVDWDGATKTVIIKSSTETEPPQSTKIAFDKLKETIKTKGKYQEQGNLYSMNIPNDELTILFVYSVEMNMVVLAFGDASDDDKITNMIYIKDENVSGAIQYEYLDYKLVMLYEYKEGDFVVSYNDFPASMSESLNNMIAEGIELFDILLEQYADVNFSDFGVYY